MKLFFAGLSTLIAAVFMTTLASADNSPMKTYSLQAAYVDVVQEVEDGITDAGLEIAFRGKISDFLDRTSKAVGAKVKVYKHAEFIQFCSVLLTRNMMEADAANMGVCPYIIFVYETEKKPGTISVGYR